MVERVDCVVIGAGVIGLSVARELASAGLETLLIEKSDLFGSETSSRNSEVIHGGIYYTPGSKKADFCVEGKLSLYKYCKERSIDHKQCGKLIVATTRDQVVNLEAIRANARANGVHDLRLLTREQTLELESELDCYASLYSPSTGIIDSHSYMLSVLGDFERAGGLLAYRSPIMGAIVMPEGILLRIGGSDEMELLASKVVNCAGLSAQQIAGMIKGIDSSTIPEEYYAKGSYFSISRKSPFNHLIYPVPENAGLGIHLTFDLSGGTKFGPNVQWVDEVNYEVDDNLDQDFYLAIEKYWPSIRNHKLVADYAGIRPKLCGPGEPAKDFMIHGALEHGVEGLVNLYGIESPGLTASLAIARYVREII